VNGIVGANLQIVASTLGEVIRPPLVWVVVCATLVWVVVRPLACLIELRPLDRLKNPIKIWWWVILVIVGCLNIRGERRNSHRSSP
jgi:uncharacterized protein with PQ loop repeat